MVRKILFTSAAACVLVACSQIPREAYYNRGNPESLLDTSSEVVNIKLGSRSSLQELANIIDKDQPTRADLKCVSNDANCVRAKKILQQFAVPVNYVQAKSFSVSLVYERVVARDCDNRYIDNPINPYNLNHPVFGCSVAANIVQMVSDKRQFTAPLLVGKPDAFKATQAMDAYSAAPAAGGAAGGGDAGGGATAAGSTGR
ncbi:MAG: hypothetical protein WCL30_00050 [Pseudomonadota bacterium]